MALLGQKTNGHVTTMCACMHMFAYHSCRYWNYYLYYL